MFITLAGIEGSGKTTQIQAISAYFTSINQKHILTREPGGTEIGRRVRQILLDPKSKGIVSKAEMLLYAADRSQHVEAVIKPALSSGYHVISDRFHDCTTAFQGFGREIDINMIHRIHELVLDGFRPDLTFLLDIDPEKGLARAVGQLTNGSRDMKESRFEQEAIDFHQKVRNGYLWCAKKEKERFVIIDASQPINEVSNAIISAIKAKQDPTKTIHKDTVWSFREQSIS